jgi:dTDP-glucose pyrophosphorylase
MSIRLCHDLENFLVAPETTLREALETLERLDSDVLLVADSSQRLLGVITDGDIRRTLLRKVELTNPASTFMSSTPYTARSGLAPTQYIHELKDKKVRHIPIVDEENRVVDLAILERLLPPEPCKSPAVIMAGGLGSRLGPLTQATPKPLLKVGDEPILSRILHSLRRNGIEDVYLCINHLGEQIERYVGDGSAWKLKVRYVRENQRMGTAGALSLLPPEATERPFIVMNGDLVTLVRYVNLLSYHSAYAYDLTVCVSQYDLQIPFGVVENDGPLVSAIKEKPVQNFLINAGIYVVNPSILPLIPTGKPFDMHSVLQEGLKRGLKIGCFPIREYWIDVGTPHDLERANGEAK